MLVHQSTIVARLVEVAAELTRRGVPSESSGAWTYQAVASVRHRLAEMAAVYAKRA